MNARVAAAILAVTAVVVLFFVFRPDDEEEAQRPTTRAAPTTTATTATTAEPTTSEGQTTEQPQVSEIAVRDGLPIGGPLSARAAQGDLVELRVFADVTDEVHLHGYDLKATVTPQRPARLRFRASLTGRFEVELEESGIQVGRLTVVP